MAALRERAAPRGLRFRTETLDTAVAARMSRMFGTDIWLEALDAARKNILTGGQFRAELTNLMRWRLEHDLGYQTTLHFQVTNTAHAAEVDRIRADATRERDELREALGARAQALEESRTELRARAERAERELDRLRQAPAGDDQGSTPPARRRRGAQGRDAEAGQ
jgi:hypothetical protein